MKIVLSGVETNNKGAELMLYAILQEIERKHPDAIVYIPYSDIRQGLGYVTTSLDFRFTPLSQFIYKTHLVRVFRQLHLPLKWLYKANIVKHADYLLSYEKNLINGETTEIHLPKSNVLSYSLQGDNAIIVRPSGTEPKIKIYFTGVGTDKDDAVRVTNNLIDYVKNSELFFPKG